MFRSLPFRYAATSIILSLACGYASAQTAIYMAVDGDDESSGNTPQSQDPRHGPVRTFDRAIEILRVRKAIQGRVGAPYSIKLGPGIYRVDHTIILDDRDSGYPYAPTKLEPSGTGEVTISGGVPLHGQVVGNVWKAQLPFIATSKAAQLFVSDQRRLSASFPEFGLLTGTYRVIGGLASIYFDAPLPLKGLRETSRITAIVFVKWTTARFTDAKFDRARRVINLPAHLPKHLGKNGDKIAFKISDLDRVALVGGRFALDIGSNDLIYSLRPEESVVTDAVTPVVQTLLQIKGRSQPARYIEVERIKFSHTSWAPQRPMEVTTQAEVNQPGAIEIDTATDIKLFQFAVTHVGGAAIVARQGIAKIAMDGCELADLGAGGILVGDPKDRGRGAIAARPIGITIRRCSIRGFGRNSPAAAGIWIGNAAKVDISGNSISNGYYSGISAGWSWGLTGSSLSHVRITGNHVSRIGFGLLSDMGAIYTLGVTNDTLVLGNVIEDVQAGGYGGWGLYADEGTSNVVFADNIVLNTSAEPLHLHFTGPNIIRHNYLWSGLKGIRCSPSNDFSTTVFEANVIVTERQNPWGWGCTRQGFDIRKNNNITRLKNAPLTQLSEIPEFYKFIAKRVGRTDPLIFTRNLPVVLKSF